MGHSPFGYEWIVDAQGCDPEILRSRERLEALLREIVAASGLNPLGAPSWHVFEDEAGVTGLQMLGESHLACHTYPEAGYAAFSLYCCRATPIEWPWRTRLAAVIGATEVTVRLVRRGPTRAPRT